MKKSGNPSPPPPGGTFFKKKKKIRGPMGPPEMRVGPPAPCEQVGASFLHFTFTGDSFERIKQVWTVDTGGSAFWVWYHTHLFPATQTIGLSSIDLRLHFTTFRIPWQIAGLLNLDGAERVLRFYVRRNDTMALCHHQPVAEDNNP